MQLSQDLNQEELELASKVRGNEATREANEDDSPSRRDMEAPRFYITTMIWKVILGTLLQREWKGIKEKLLWRDSRRLRARILYLLGVNSWRGIHRAWKLAGHTSCDALRGAVKILH